MKAGPLAGLGRPGGLALRARSVVGDMATWARVAGTDATHKSVRGCIGVCRAFMMCGGYRVVGHDQPSGQHP